MRNCDNCDKFPCVSNITGIDNYCVLRNHEGWTPKREGVIKKGLKFDADKPRLGLVFEGFAKPLIEVGKVGTFGAKKYAPNDWKLVESERYKDALFRHLFTWLSGEKIDSETSLHHLAHAAWNCLALLYIELKGGN